jgi:hypothetical protein
MNPTLARWIAAVVVGTVGLAIGLFLGLRLRNPSDWREEALGTTMASRRSYTLPLNNPDMIPAPEARHMQDDDIVLGVLLRGGPRAYPWWLTCNYHVVNDTVDEEPLLVTLCEVCGGAAAFRPVVPDLPGITLTFQIRGINHGTIELGDHQTWSQWHPFLGTALSGPLAGRSLEQYPLHLMPWNEWTNRYPNSLVVNGSRQLRKRSHGAKSDHIGEPDIPPLFQRSANLTDDRLDRHELVLGLSLTESGKAYAIPASRLVPFPNLFAVHMDGEFVLIARQSELAITAFDVEPVENEPGFKLISRNPFLFHCPTGMTWNAFGLPQQPASGGDQLPMRRGYVTEWYEWVSHSPHTEIVHSVSPID